jgi:alcohol dehydrogenase (cytochrome c)
MTGSYDDATDTVFWGVGNPAPLWNGSVRQGDNLYSNSVVALDARTGTLRWHFQFTPHDMHDWDSGQVPVLVEDPAGVTAGKLLAWPNRNGFFYSLDARTGRFIQGRPFVRQTWAEGLDASGRPRSLPNTEPTTRGTHLWPSAEGATNWWPPAYDRKLRQLYVPVMERPGIYYSGRPRKPTAGELYLGSAVQSVEGEPYYTAVRALDPYSGELRWEHRFAERTPEMQRTEIGGLMATAGGLVFGSDDTVFRALDARTGKQLWQFNIGAMIVAPPITYSVGGRQMVAIAAGRALLAFELAD